MTTSYPYGATIVSESITGVTAPVPTFGGLTAAKDYLGARSVPGAVAFMALTSPDEQRKRLVDAKDMFDSLGWRDIADSDAAAAATAILNASYQLAGLVAADNEVTAAADAGSNVAELNAKGVSIRFFRPTTAQNGTATLLPTIIQRLVGKYLASADPSVAAAAAGVSTGTDSESSFDDCDRMTISGAY